MANKKMVVTFYQQNHVRTDWNVDLSGSQFELFFIELAEDLSKCGIEITKVIDKETGIDIRSYTDLLNSVRIASPTDGFSSICVGHVLGKSPHLDIFEDIKRAVNRIAFAPETIAPESHNRQVCHNCGCGC